MRLSSEIPMNFLANRHIPPWLKRLTLVNPWIYSMTMLDHTITLVEVVSALLCPGHLVRL